jgi:thiosulfate reductase cytochrome b subunit
VPKGRVWTAKDDSVTLPTWLGVPGLRHTVGLARWWHFSVNLLWLINGIAFYALLFSTDQWRRLVPLTWEVFPAALSTAIQYASLNFPVDHSWTRYNGLQQLSYFITLFVAAPVSIATGLMQSPAISNALGWFGRLFNRQAMRSVHFISFAWFAGFILAHGAMVFVTGIRQNTNHMFGGVDDASWTEFPLFVLTMAILTIAWLVASPYTIRHARLVQRAGAFVVGWVMGLAEGWDPRSQPRPTSGRTARCPTRKSSMTSCRTGLPVTGCGSAVSSRRRRNSLSPISRRWRSRTRSRRISASRAGPASPNGAAFPCARSSIW